jgi:hypothetical protein
MDMKTYVAFCLARGVQAYQLSMDQVRSQDEVIMVVKNRFRRAADQCENNQAKRDTFTTRKEAVKTMDYIKEKFVSALENREWIQENLTNKMTRAQFINRLNRVMSNKYFLWEKNFVLGGRYGNWQEKDDNIISHGLLVI